MLEGNNEWIDQGAKTRAMTQPNGRANLQYLRELSGDDTDFIKEIIQMFIDDAPVLLKQAIIYHKNSNLALLKASIHRMKSSVKMMGDQELASLIQRIEEHCVGVNEVANLPTLMMQLNKGLTELLFDLKAQMAKL